MAEWVIYIPEEGHWPIAYDGEDWYAARRAYLKWAGRKILPPGSWISRTDVVSATKVVRRSHHGDDEGG